MFMAVRNMEGMAEDISTLPHTSFPLASLQKFLKTTEYYGKVHHEEVLQSKVKTMGITGMHLSKMESNLPVIFYGDIVYIRYQHPDGDSPEIKKSGQTLVKEDSLPHSHKIAVEESSRTFDEIAKQIRTRSSPSHSRHPRYRRSRRRRKRRAQLVEDVGPFADQTLRRSFLWKLYLMLAFQLGYTVAIMCMFIYWDYLHIWVRRRPWFCYALLPSILIMAIALACCDNARRKFPLNCILLAIFTILEGTMLGSIASFFDAHTLMWAVGSTSFVMWGLYFFALQRKWELTITSGVLLILLLVTIVTGILCIILQSRWSDISYAAFGTLLFSIYLLVDTQLMLGKKHHYRLDPNEYVFAVLNVYIDILNMFLFILRFVGFMK